ncbi:MAG: CoA transferase [Dehalococcoidia bacterium]
MTNKGLPLEGLKVIELCWLFAGPIVCKMLADHGAEVIKIESPHKPDDVRGYGPYKDDIPGVNRGPIFANYNSSKLGMTCDLKNRRGLQIAKQLIARADVVVESFSPGALERLGLGYEEMAKLKPDIILASISMQGKTGPYADQPMFGTQLQGGAGFCSLTGWPDRPPLALPTPLTDFIQPMFALTAILGALEYRDRTGRGQHIDVSQLEAGLHFLTPPLLDYTVNHRIAGRVGNRNRDGAPHGVYPCKGEDRWCAIAVFSNREWQACCEIMDNPEWSKEPRFASLPARKDNEDELDSLIAAWTVDLSPQEVMIRMQAAGVASGMVQNGPDLLDGDPQLAYREHSCLLDHPEMGKHITERAPFRFSATPSSPRWQAPCLGEHNEFVCKEILGMNDADFMDLYQSGIFG